MYPDFAVFFRNTALQSFGVSAYAFKPAPCLAKKSLQNYLIIGAYACAHSPCSAPKFTRNTLQSFSAILRCSLSAYLHTPSSLRLVLRKNPCKIILLSVHMPAPIRLVPHQNSLEILCSLFPSFLRFAVSQYLHTARATKRNLTKKSLQNYISFSLAILRCSLSAYLHTVSTIKRNKNGHPERSEGSRVQVDYICKRFFGFASE